MRNCTLRAVAAAERSSIKQALHLRLGRIAPTNFSVLPRETHPGGLKMARHDIQSISTVVPLIFDH